jgi:hypothetical protein
VPEVAFALHAFAMACSQHAKSGEPPVEFSRVDLRVLAPHRGQRRKNPMITAGEVARLLGPDEASLLVALDATVTALGFEPEIRSSGMRRGEWRGSYTHKRLKRTLFGFAVEDGELEFRLVLENTQRILPTLALCPQDFRERYYQACQCTLCGACKGKDTVVKLLDGAERRLCGFSYFAIKDPQPSHLEPSRLLLMTQGGYLYAQAGLQRPGGEFDSSSAG